MARRLALLLCAAGCAGRALPVPAGDLGADAGACGVTYERAAVPLIELSVLGGSDDYFAFTTMRLHIAYALREGCDVPADIELTPSLLSSSASLSITAFAWLGSGSCGAARTVTEDVVLPLLSVNGILIEDGAPGATVPPLELGLNETSVLCTPTALGDPCVFDCDCTAASPTALCLSGTDGFQHCGHACNDDVDCAGMPEGPTCLGPPTRICGKTTSCRDPQDCGYGEIVSDCVCTRPAPAGPIPETCGCDADCPGGTICSGNACVIPCTDNASCPDTCGASCFACAEGACVSLTN